MLILRDKLVNNKSFLKVSTASGRNWNDRITLKYSFTSKITATIKNVRAMIHSQWRLQKSSWHYKSLGNGNLNSNYTSNSLTKGNITNRFYYWIPIYIFTQSFKTKSFNTCASDDKLLELQTSDVFKESVLYKCNGGAWSISLILNQSTYSLKQKMSNHLIWAPYISLVFITMNYKVLEIINLCTQKTMQNLGTDRLTHWSVVLSF